MKESYDLIDNYEREALLNEYKGNIFEYLVASNISHHYSLFKSFDQKIQPELKEKLIYYQEHINECDQELYASLPALAIDTAKEVIDYLESNNNQAPNDVLLIGKASFENKQDMFSEADILIKYENDVIPISLKLSKGNAWVNTKSAGIKSFLSKYFNIFNSSKSDQIFLNEQLEVEFRRFSFKMHDMAGLNLQGEFREDWKNNDLPDRPGKLNAEMNIEVKKLYHKLILKIHHILNSYYERDEDLFKLSLGPLMGVSSDDILQVTCFHKEIKGSKHQLKDVLIEKFEGPKSSECKIGQVEKDGSSFEILIGNKKLQIRIKPMNTFTTMSYKVNCSIK